MNEWMDGWGGHSNGHRHTHTPSMSIVEARERIVVGVSVLLC
jgi:hypothetical protein